MSFSFITLTLFAEGDPGSREPIDVHASHIETYQPVVRKSDGGTVTLTEIIVAGRERIVYESPFEIRGLLGVDPDEEHVGFAFVETPSVLEAIKTHHASQAQEGSVGNE